jgi:hypothetical protein
VKQFYEVAKRQEEIEQRRLADRPRPSGTLHACADPSGLTMNRKAREDVTREPSCFKDLCILCFRKNENKNIYARVVKQKAKKIKHQQISGIEKMYDTEAVYACRIQGPQDRPRGNVLMFDEYLINGCFDWVCSKGTDFSATALFVALDIR